MQAPAATPSAPAHSPAGANLAKGSSADVICSASTIPRVTIRELFSAGPLLRVPVFQRRYCWGQKQLSKLLMDLYPLTSKPTPRSARSSNSKLPASLQLLYESHSLGRLVLADHPDVHGDLMVIDGQQRITTICIILSTLRDLFPTNSSVYQEIQSILCPRSTDQTACVVTPTLFDRASFNACVRFPGRNRIPNEQSASSNLRSGAKESGSVTSSDHVMACHLFMKAALPGLLSRIQSKLGFQGKGSNGHVLELCGRSLVNALMDRCTILCFKMRERGDEVLAAYSRLAMRDAVFSFQINNRSPGVKMQFLDLARNLICCQFPGGGEKARVEGYKKFWLPIEQWAMESAGDKQNIAGSMVEILDQLLKEFVAEESHHNSLHDETANAGEGSSKRTTSSAALGWMDPGQYTFPMYTQLQLCISRASTVPGGVEAMLVRLLAKAKSMRVVANKMPQPTEIICPCRARGTLCADCIVKQAQTGGL